MTVSFGYRMRYSGKQVVSTAYETQNAFQGRPSTNPDAFPIIYYPAVTYHDFRLDISPPGKFKFYMGVDSAFDKLPTVRPAGQ
jgi:hypothetical protein